MKEHKNNSYDQFKKVSKIYEEKPNEHLWERLESKLDNRRNYKKLKFYKILAFAAIITTLLASVSLFNHYLNEHNPNLLVSNEGFNIMNLEVLPNNDESFFDVSSFQKIKEAYSTGKSKNKELEIIGHYDDENGSISFDIAISNFGYTLKFSSNNLPELELSKQEGNMLTFESKNGKYVDFNLEENILQINESNFLPEYQGFNFVNNHSKEQLLREI